MARMTVNLGRAGFVLKGQWNAATYYTELDVVYHNGASWAAKRLSENIEPSAENSDDWQMIIGGNASIDDTASDGDTDKVWSADKTFSEFDQVKNALNYQPMAITSFTASPATAEIGDTPKSVTLACAFNKTPASVSLDGVEKNASYTGETVSAEDGGTHSKSWTLSATDAGRWADEPHTAQATAQIKWLPKVYYGAAAIPEGINSAFLLGLANGVLATSRARTFTVTAGSGQYIWYASPVNYGACAFSVGGFDGGFEAAQTVSVTNASGYTQNYYVYRSSNANLGSTTVVVK